LRFALLEADAAEWRQLDGLCRVSISRFYRDRGVWSRLERELLPQLAMQASMRGETRLRIWSVAFERSGGEFCLGLEYRPPVRFLAQDIRRDFPDGRFDLVLCRNLVFTYFQTSPQAVIAGRLAEVLVPGGLLLLGSHESLPAAVPGLTQERPWLYRGEMK